MDGKPFAEQHRVAHARVCGSSKHTSSQLRGEDGEMTVVRAFDEDFPNKQRFARMVYMDYAVPSHTRKPATRAYYEGLDPCHTPPEAETLARIIYSIEDEMNAELVTILNQERSKTGGTFLGEQSDMMTRNRTSYITLNGTVMLEHEAPKESPPGTRSTLQLQPFLLMYKEFPSTTHTGEDIAECWGDRHKVLGVSTLDIGTPTIDGAKNGRKAVRILLANGREARYCSGHNNARAVLKSLGKTGKQRKNPRARRILGVMRRYSGFKRKSTRYSKDLDDQQIRLLDKKRELTLPNVTHWDGDLECIENSVHVEPAADKVKKQTKKTMGSKGDEVPELPSSELPTITDDTAGTDDSDIDNHSNDSAIESDDDNDKNVAVAQPVGRTALAPQASKLTHVQKVLKYTPKQTDFDEARDLAATLDIARQLSKVTQHSKRPCNDTFLSHARAAIVASRAAEVEVPTWKKIVRDQADVQFKWALRYDKTPAVSLREAASTQREIYADTLEEHMFSDVDSQDLIALMLNPTQDARAVLGTDELYDRAVSEFSAAFHTVELELGLAKPQSAVPVAPVAEKSCNTPSQQPASLAALTARLVNKTPPPTPRPLSALEEFEQLRQKFCAS